VHPATGSSQPLWPATSVIHGSGRRSASAHRRAGSRPGVVGEPVSRKTRPGNGKAVEIADLCENQALSSEEHRSRLSGTVRQIGVTPRILRQALPNRATPDTWPTWDRLGPHITSLAESALEVSGYLQDLPPLVAELARVTAARGAPHLASDFLEGLVKYSSARRSEVPLDDAVTTAHNWATSLLELRDASRAVLVFREVVAMDAAAGDEPTPRSVGSMIGLANALMDTGEVEEGLVVIADASLVLESALSADDDVGIQLYGTWGRLLVAAGRSAEARDPLTRALERARRAHFVERAALCLTHLGNAALLDGELSEAEDWYEQGLVELEQLPEERYLRAVLLGGLASVLSAQGDVGGAIADVDAGLAALAELPEGMHLAFAGSLKFKRAQLRLVNGTDVRDVITEAGEGFDLLCDHHKTVTQTPVKVKGGQRSQPGTPWAPYFIALSLGGR